jgi:hypothetical protein
MIGVSSAGRPRTRSHDPQGLQHLSLCFSVVFYSATTPGRTGCAEERSAGKPAATVGRAHRDRKNPFRGNDMHNGRCLAGWLSPVAGVSLRKTPKPLTSALHR